MSSLRTPLRWSVVTAGAYTLLALAVTVVEYLSEVSKIDRGTYSDTFSPFLFTRLLSFPMSAVLPGWPGYPLPFDEARYRATLRDQLWPTSLGVLLQALLVGGIAWTIAFFFRRRARADTLVT
jgi:hypothetical protein